MIGANVPCPDDPALVCGAGGGSWWPLIIGAVVLALAWRRGFPR